MDYPDFAEAVGKALINGEGERGVLICGSGVGASVAVNKVCLLYTSPSPRDS